MYGYEVDEQAWFDHEANMKAAETVDIAEDFAVTLIEHDIHQACSDDDLIALAQVAQTSPNTNLALAFTAQQWLDEWKAF